MNKGAIEFQGDKIMGISSVGFAVYGQNYNLNVNKQQIQNLAAADFYDELSTSQSKSVDGVVEKLNDKFGTNIMIGEFADGEAVLKSGAFGKGNVAIAEEILEKMAEDPDAMQKYSKEIQKYFDNIPYGDQFMASVGRRVVDSGIIIHKNGEVTTWSHSEYTPEEKARLERAMKEEADEKEKRRKRYFELMTKPF